MLNLGSFIRQIDRHLLKQGVDIVVVDLYGTSPAERQAIEAHVLHIPDPQRARVLLQG